MKKSKIILIATIFLSLILTFTLLFAGGKEKEEVVVEKEELGPLPGEPIPVVFHNARSKQLFCLELGS